MMKFYNNTHQFYCGVDLHAKTLHACVVDTNGTKVLHKNFQCQEPNVFLDAIEPFRADLVVGCESTFNWYWLADFIGQQRIPFILGHALYMKAIHGGKTKSDAIDSEKIARLIRGGNFPLAHSYPKEHRATRDLLRRRTFLVRRRAEALTHIQMVHHQHNLPKPTNIKYKANRNGVGDQLPSEHARLSFGNSIGTIAPLALTLCAVALQPIFSKPGSVSNSFKSISASSPSAAVNTYSRLSCVDMN